MTLLLAVATGAVPAIAAPQSAPIVLASPTARHIGDLEGMIERRTIRVLTVYDQTSFFFDNGTPRGIAYEALTAFGVDLNRKLRTSDRPIGMEFIPIER
jgi:membrane-bound lytic murein transglycosylase MltF